MLCLRASGRATLIFVCEDFLRKATSEALTPGGISPFMKLHYFCWRYTLEATAGAIRESNDC